MRVRPARRDDSDAVAALLRAGLDAVLPHLPALHTPEEDRAFVRDRVFAECDVRVAEVDGAIAGFIATRPGWIDHLYVRPGAWRRGIGSALLLAGLRDERFVQLWTFQRNEGARRFYERFGFRAVRETDGENEEREPDVLYAWERAREGDDGPAQE